MSTLEEPGTADRRQPAPSLTQFLGPRYWPTWLLVGWLHLLARLPWRGAIRVSRGVGRALWYLLPGRRRVVLRNLEICFPELGAAQRHALGRGSFENVAASVAEIAIAWFGTSLPPARIEGREHLEAALGRGKGVILFSGHFTTLELTAQFITPMIPSFAFMFRTRHNPLLDAIQARGRRRTSHLSFSNSDSRAMLRALRDNAVVWYAPDQAYGGPGAELLPFFGEPAMTNTATTRLARLSGSVVLPFQFRRLDDDSGYSVGFEPPVEDVPSDDAIADTKRLTGILERFVRACPQQYLWTHRRFRSRPNLPNGYARPVAQEGAPRTRRHSVLAAPALIVAVALFIVGADNDTFWQGAWRATLNDEHRLAILWSLFALVFCTLTTLLSLALGTKLLRVCSALLLLVAASCGYFMAQFGVVIDESMIRNAAETTVLEATPLLSAAYFWHLALYGVLPALLVLFVPLGRLRWQAAVAARAVTAAVALATLFATLYVNYAAVSFFGRDNDDLRLQINPVYPLYAAIKFGFGSDDSAPQERRPLDLRSAAVPEKGKPALVVLVMGETARADRFSLNGYERDTNRYTKARDVVNFPRVVSCGTSTAESVPCIFSGLGQKGFSHAAAAAHESLFGALQRLGVSTFWRDNSTGCKDVCDDQHFEQRANWTDAELCDATGCFDELLLQNFDQLLAERTQDHFIVLHQRGSHGPAYYTDVPQWAKEYFPECNLASLRNCDRAAINNSYDNTILYTDYFLSRVIDELEKRSDEFTTAMLYVSDHGESLGENGLYLHGFPYAMAPREQIQVPMLLWASPSFYAQRAHVDPQCVRRSAQHDTSHDAIFHTLLPLFGVESPLYDEKLDLLAGCRENHLSAVTAR
ncbi:MAG TPA: phosphoethanolamine--lipid A transferase [Gammaproteobacteria bacterium]|nr:phosphoethanolamine--lipid A transferase [Gammaproteobacteria bacterium]